MMFIGLFLFLTAAAAFGRDEVRSAADAFQNGDYFKASEDFAVAAERNPEDARIAYNHAAALVAANKPDEATAILEKTAVAPDKQVAARSLLLLGGIAVERARQALSTEDLPPEKRQEILNRLAAAEKSYSEVLQIDPAHQTVRRNLEELRAWRNRIREEWLDADRAKHRQGEVPGRLGWLEDWQDELRGKIQTRAAEPDSPRKFQEIYETGKDQRRLAGEIALLQDDLRQYQAERDAQGAEEGERQATEQFIAELDRLRNAANGVEERLARFQTKEALDEARLLQEQLSRLRLHLASFEEIVQEAERRQAMLCDANPESGPESDKALEEDARLQALRDQVEEQIRRQKAVASWMPLMVYRARQGLEELQQNSGPQNQPAPETSAPMPGSADSPEDARRKSLELAVQYGPKIAELAEDAVDLLARNAPEAALPHQRQALEMLREILRQQQQDQDQQQQQQDQQNQDQQEQDQQDQDQNQQDQNQQNQDQQNGQQNSEQKPEQNGEDQQEQQPQDQQAEQQQQQAEPKPTEAESQTEQQQDEAKDAEDKQRAEQQLRQVKRRQQEATDRRERIRAMFRRMEPVEKDW